MIWYLFAIWSVAFVAFSMPTEAIVALDPATLTCFAFKWPSPQRLKGGLEVRVGPGTYLNPRNSQSVSAFLSPKWTAPNLCFLLQRRAGARHSKLRQRDS